MSPSRSRKLTASLLMSLIPTIGAPRLVLTSAKTCARMSMARGDGTDEPKGSHDGTKDEMKATTLLSHRVTDLPQRSCSE